MQTDKMGRAQVVVLLIVSQAILGLQAQNVGLCLDSLVRSINAGADRCSQINEFIKCLLQELNLFTTDVSESNITKLVNFVNENLAMAGLHCNVDVGNIVKKIREEGISRATQTSRKPTGYYEAQTLGDCVNVLNRPGIQAAGISCPAVIPYLKCVIRVTGYYKYQYTDQQYSSMERQIITPLQQLGLYCTFDIRELSAKVAREQMVPNTEYDDAQTMRDCLNALTRINTLAADLSCASVTPFLRCVTRVTGYYTYQYTDQEYWFMESQIDTMLQHLDLFCRFDIRALSAEMAREQTVPNTGSGFSTAATQAFATILTILLIWNN